MIHIKGNKSGNTIASFDSLLAAWGYIEDNQLVQDKERNIKEFCVIKKQLVRNTNNVLLHLEIRHTGEALSIYIKED